MFPILPFLLLSASTAVVPGGTASFGSAIGVQGGLHRGSKGQQVKNWQFWLMSQGFNFPLYGPDGDFGSETEGATKAFQARNGLPQSGTLDTPTLSQAMRLGYGREKPAVQLMAEQQGSAPSGSPVPSGSIPSSPAPAGGGWKPPPLPFYKRPVVLGVLALGSVGLLGWGVSRQLGESNRHEWAARDFGY